MTSSRKGGRPREFNADQALEAAMHAFWEHGFEATSLAMLREATGLTTPQIYNRFGNKESFFRAALTRYFEQEAAFAIEALGSPGTAKAAISNLLQRAAEVYTRPGKPSGCLFVTGALAVSTEAKTVAEELKRFRKESEEAIARRIELGIELGDVPRIEHRKLAKYFVGVIHGMSIQARDGATVEELRDCAQIAMQNWPRAIESR